jgi:hypothetical protein
VRGIVAAHAKDRITLYTNNNDHIVLDLVTPYSVRRGDADVVVRIKGGLLGHWSVWTTSAVDLLRIIHVVVERGAIPLEILELDARITDANAAFFDVAHDFAGCIAGCHEVLRRQGLFAGTWCLDANETLSPGQAEEIARVMAAYPELDDTEFVRANLDRWLA